MMIKKIIFSILALVAIAPAAKPYEVGDEDLRYDVYFKWGLISKKAGEVNINALTQTDGTFQATMTGRSARWADRFYQVRDTMQGRISSQGFYPQSYLLVSHEGGVFKRETISYTRNGDNVTARCNRYVQKKNKPMTHTEIELSANGYTLDMMSAFYYMRFMDYQNMQPGQTQKLFIFSGKAKEILTITFQGNAEFSYKSIKTAPVYKIKFSFTSKTQKKSSGDIFAWIGKESRIPYKLQGDLAIGNIQCLYVPE